MKKYLAALAMLLVCSAVFAADEQALTAHKFRIYYLVKGEMAKKPAMPDFGYMIQKTFPLRAKEFLLPARYSEFSKPVISKTAAAILETLPEHRRKNAVYASEAVFNYVKASITAKAEPEGVFSNPHEAYSSGAEAIGNGSGNNLEKCRAATALLRSISIPARISYWSGHYVVEYYIKPLEKGKYDPDWHIMDFTGAYDAAEGRVEPISWNPVDYKEHVNEEWSGNSMNVRVVSVKNTHMELNEAESMALFSNIVSGAEPDVKGNTTLNKFFLLKEVDYELTLPDGITAAMAEFTMPFNETRYFKTFKFYVRPLDPGLKVSQKRTHTYINPYVKGMIYTLPVEFSISK